MLALVLAAWLVVPNPHEEWVFRGIDAVEMTVNPRARDCRIGATFILGNDETPHDVILDRLSLYPGNPAYWWRLRLAEVRLAAPGLFGGPPSLRAWPRVTYWVTDPTSHYLDVKVELEERGKAPPRQ
jgi:hypothetical protein